MTIYNERQLILKDKLKNEKKILNKKLINKKCCRNKNKNYKKEESNSIFYIQKNRIN